MSLEEAGSLDTQSGASYEDTDAQREGHVTTDAEAGVKQLQATDARPPADAAKSTAGRQGPPTEPQGEPGPADASTSDSQPPEL